jgi:hypothetical protein
MAGILARVAKLIFRDGKLLWKDGTCECCGDYEFCEDCVAAITGIRITLSGFTDEVCPTSSCSGGPGGLSEVFYSNLNGTYDLVTEITAEIGYDRTFELDIGAVNGCFGHTGLLLNQCLDADGSFNEFWGVRLVASIVCVFGDVYVLLSIKADTVTWNETLDICTEGGEGNWDTTPEYSSAFEDACNASTPFGGALTLDSFSPACDSSTGTISITLL